MTNEEIFNKLNTKYRHRGQSLRNGAWIYGHLITGNNGSACILPPFNEGKHTKVIQYAVRPETIGQFSGFYDKNTVEIFEGDMIEVRDRSQNPVVTPVVLREGAFGYELYGRFFPMQSNEGAKFNAQGYSQDCLIVGNVHRLPFDPDK